MNKEEIYTQNYERIEKAIQYLVDNFKQQPKLEEIAQHINLSQFHFQRLFKEWAGVSPKKFIEFLTIQHAKMKLLEREKSLLELTEESGLSSSSRLHDLFINIEGMSPGTFKKKGEGLKISVSVYNTLFGSILIGATETGICLASFTDNNTTNTSEIQHKFPKAKIVIEKHQHHKSIVDFINQKGSLNQINLHLSGTPFQLKVWQALINIPEGNLASYNQVAKMIHQENATRAVASAIARNPIAVLIPCHRVIQSTGMFGQYHWGTARKTALIGFEASKNLSEFK